MKGILWAALLLAVAAAPSPAGSIFLTGHDPDFHAYLGGNTVGAQHINQAAINFILDPLYNPYAAGGVNRLLYVQSTMAPPGGHIDGELGLGASGYAAGVDYDERDAATLNAALDQLGTTYGGIVVASDFGAILTQAELDILNNRSADIINFINGGGGVYAMAESNSGAHLTPNGGWFGYLPFVVSSTTFDQGESGFTVTPYGQSLGLTDADVNGNFSHNIFVSDFGMEVVDRDAQENILSLAFHGEVGPGGPVPEPSTLALLGLGLCSGALLLRRRRT